jgi:hypothetical protein
VRWDSGGRFFGICSPMKTQHGHASQKTHVTWRYSLLCDITAHAPVARTERKMSRNRYLQSCDVTSDTEKTASPIVARTYFRRGPEMTSFYCCALEHVYGGVAWQWIFMLQYLRI